MFDNREFPCPVLAGCSRVGEEVITAMAYSLMATALCLRMGLPRPFQRNNLKLIINNYEEGRHQKSRAKITYFCHK
jgi:hypothetical protein